MIDDPNPLKIITIILVLVAIIAGGMLFHLRSKIPDQLRDTKSWCLKNQGTPTYVGYSDSWNCSFNK